MAGSSFSSETEQFSDVRDTADVNKEDQRHEEQGHEHELKKYYIGSIDQGTTSSRFIIFDATGTPVAMHQLEFEQIYPHSGWHEQDPYEILQSVETCVTKATEAFVAKGLSVSHIKAIGITNQRETTILWDSETGKPLYNAIAWPDTRTLHIVQELKKKEGADEVATLCGLPISSYPSSVKLVWLIRHCEKVREAYEAGRLMFGTVDSWLIYNLNGGPERNIHITDATNASRTMFANLSSLQYDDKLLDFFGIDRNKVRLPRIIPSSDREAFGSISRGPLKGVPITGCLGDQSSALVGQCAFEPGMAKNTYGTGCFLLYNVGDKPVISKHGLLATVAYDFGGSHGPVYALEGNVAVAGSGVKFLMNNMGFFRDSSKISEVALSVEDSGGVIFVTAFSGLFAPYWIDDAKGTMFGITQHTKRGHIARATLEATCFQTRAILEAMEKDSGHKLSQLAVDGGMCNSDICMQTQADIIRIPVDRPFMRESTALGAAIAAGYAVGLWTEYKELMRINRADRTIFKPQITQKESEKMYKRWGKAVEMCRGWIDTTDDNNDDDDV
ncbi:glycerol kinase [Xylona heveae TC161]|uniref:glycerol kinase n=1 Tax=Xylona heveae (strain CBS 132557 / TC161) TaxID=1328760 RepID=A0A165IFU4_XYLHT|nr:glycerol kinase [Xylona heveae TC161]KZF24834.1 glycerol kinase [Xylona heveae TC161]